MSASEPTHDRQVGVWIRVSSENQAQGDSPKHHEHRARAYATAKNWEVCEVYHLEAVSGRSVRENPEAQRMLEDVRRGRITALIFSKLARLARNTRELLDFADFFREHGADLISLDEAIDTTSPAGRLFYTMIAAMAEWEREEIAARVSASVHVRAKLGMPLGGQAPFGYQYVDKQLVPDPDEAPIRRLICELYIECRRKKTVADTLNKRGYRTRRGFRFSPTTIDRLLRDTTPKGIHRRNYTKTLEEGGKKQVVRKPKDEWIEVPVEAIVPEDVWNQANAILEAQTTRRPLGKRPRHLFAGMAECECGQKMYVPSSTLKTTPKYVCNACYRKIPTDDLEAVFTAQLQAFLLSPDQIIKLLEQTDETIRERERLLKTLEREHRKLVREIDGLHELYAQKKISSDGFGRRYQPLEERLKGLEDEVPELKGEIDFLKIQYLSRDEVVHGARDVCLRFPDLDLKEKRQIVEAITERIIVGDREVTIRLCSLPIPPSSQDVPESERTLSGSCSGFRRGSPRGGFPRLGSERHP